MPKTDPQTTDRCPFEADAPHHIEFRQNGSFVCDCGFHGDRIAWLMISRGIGVKAAKRLASEGPKP